MPAFLSIAATLLVKHAKVLTFQGVAADSPVAAEQRMARAGRALQRPTARRSVHTCWQWEGGGGCVVLPAQGKGGVKTEHMRRICAQGMGGVSED